MLRLLFFITFLASSTLNGGADLSIWTEPKAALLFARENVSVRLFLKNARPENQKMKLEFRVFQTATGVSAPIMERAPWKEVALSANQTGIEELTFSPGSIKGSTLFLLKLYEEGATREFASLPLLLYPDNLLAELKKAIETKELVVFDDENFLAPTLTALGAKKALPLDEPMVSDKPIVLFVVAPKGAELAKLAPDLAKWTGAVIWIRRPAAPTFDTLPLEVKTEGSMIAVSAERSMFSDLANSVEAQINLIRCYRAAVKQLR